ncbi:MAG: hypothetical protein ACREEQ_10985, partial [Caulobacteraceae bacterium]
MKPWQAAGLLLAIAALSAPLPALAARAAQAGPQLGPSSNGPIDITADNGAYVASTCESTWSGSAEVLQGSARLRARTIRAFFKKKVPAPGAAAQH